MLAGSITTPGGSEPPLYVPESWKLWQARPICFRLLLQLMRAAASRTFWTAGRSRPMRIAMIAITTNSSISVKPVKRRRERIIAHSQIAGHRNERAGTKGISGAAGGRVLGTRRRDTRAEDRLLQLPHRPTEHNGKIDEKRGRGAV